MASAAPGAVATRRSVNAVSCVRNACRRFAWGTDGVGAVEAFGLFSALSWLRWTSDGH